MAAFYELSDDMKIPGRWHLSDPVTVPPREPFEYRSCRRLDVSGDEQVGVTHAGRALDFTLTHFGVPIVSSRVGDEVGAIAAKALQRIPVKLDGRDGYELWNPTEKVRCLDESRSEFLKWTEADRRPDKIGGYKMVTKLRVDSSSIPSGLRIFRIEGWMIALIVSEQVATVLRRSGAVGVHLQPVTEP